MTATYTAQAVEVRTNYDEGNFERANELLLNLAVQGVDGRRVADLLRHERFLLRKITDSARHGAVEPGGVEFLAEVGAEITRSLERYDENQANQCYFCDTPLEWLVDEWVDSINQGVNCPAQPSRRPGLVPASVRYEGLHRRVADVAREGS